MKANEDPVITQEIVEGERGRIVDNDRIESTTIRKQRRCRKQISYTSIKLYSKLHHADLSVDAFAQER